MPSTTIPIEDGQAPDQIQIQNALREIVEEHGVDILGCSESGSDVFATIELQDDQVLIDVALWDTTTNYHTNIVARQSLGLNAEAHEDVAGLPDEPAPGEMSRDEVITNILSDHFEDNIADFAQSLHYQITEPAINPKAPFAHDEEMTP